MPPITPTKNISCYHFPSHTAKVPKQVAVNEKEIEAIVEMKTMYTIIYPLICILFALKIFYDFHNTYFSQAFVTLSGLYICYKRYALWNAIKANQDLNDYTSEGSLLIKKKTFNALSTLESKITPIVLSLLFINTLYLINGLYKTKERIYTLFNLALFTLLFCHGLPNLLTKNVKHSTLDNPNPIPALPTVPNSELDDWDSSSQADLETDFPPAQDQQQNVEPLYANLQDRCPVPYTPLIPNPPPDEKKIEQDYRP